MAGKIVRFFPNVSMVNSHNGLSVLAKEHGIDVKNLDPGNYVVFANTALDRLKVYAASDVVAYVRLEKGRKIDLRVIREIPKVFNGARIDYDKALERFVTKALEA